MRQIKQCFRGFGAVLAAPVAAFLKGFSILSLTACCGTAIATGIVEVSPQGEAAQVRQVSLRFDEAMVRAGDPRAGAPVSVQCEGAAAGAVAGTGRWVDERRWAFDFNADLPPGVRCAIQVSQGLRSVAGRAYKGPARYQFQTGGPFMSEWLPHGDVVAEDQAFVLALNGPASVDSVKANMWCKVSSLGERIPVKLIDGPEREVLLRHAGWHKAAAREPLRYVVAACQQRLPPGAEMQLVFGKGIATPSGIANRVEKRLDFKVREPFAASFSCEREQANAPCVPLRPVVLQFNAPVPRKLASEIRLVTPEGKRKPELGDDDGSPTGTVSGLRFTGLLPERASLRIELPAGMQDDSGRPLANADQFPMAVTTGRLPPLVKFSAAPFGIIERFAESAAKSQGKGAAPAAPALLPVTLRNVEAELKVRGLHRGTVSDLKISDDAQIIAWLARVNRLHETSIDRGTLRELTGESASGTVGRGGGGTRAARTDETMIETRTVSLLAGNRAARTLALPAPVEQNAAAARPFEVVGIPLAEPGFHVVEIASPMLGEALLGRQAPMYVRTAALVTNLGVHFKQGRENSLVWVTTLDGGKPVANAEVRVSDCAGKPLAQGRTDAQGIARIDTALPTGQYCPGLDGLFVSARIARDHPQAHGEDDMAFMLSSWHRGIENWRFDVPTDAAARPTTRVHTVFDRSLFRTGETVSMKHLIRDENRAGFAAPRSLPDRLVIEHEGSGQRHEQALKWRITAGGGRSAESVFRLPEAARLGRYTVALQGDEHQGSLYSGEFRVEAFRLPTLEGRIAPAGGVKADPWIAVSKAPLDVQINYVAGGGAANLPVRVSAVMRDRWPAFSEAEGFSFAPPQGERQARQGGAGGADSDADEEAHQADGSQRLLADKLPLLLDRQGAGRIVLDPLPAVDAPKDVVLEATFSDPNGEVQTIRNTVPLWPAGVVVGIKTAGWVSVRRKLPVQALVLDLAGKPLANVPVELTARAHVTTSTRKRLVGGFYSYDNHTEVRQLGQVCSGRSDARGLVQCEAALEASGNVELIAVAKDSAGRSAQAATSVWVTGHDEIWFGGEDHDRMDLLPEKKSWKPGETAKLQVRMPFRHATALLTVEREGIIESSVIELHGTDPAVELKIRPEWGPNVYVSVLALRGRLHQVPWYSFFTWGWKSPREWWQRFRSEGREYVAPTALVDLSKPAFRLGLAELKVGTDAYRLQVEVKSDRASYPVRGKALVDVQVRTPDGKPAANAEVALAVVDQALLELLPNSSWNLLEAMLSRRAYGVETSTAQMEIVGRRHYGRKAVPAGGGGGKSPTRELFDTLLLWQPAVRLDAQGRARVEVPLNDALTSFKVVAIADAGLSLFGTGATTIATAQDLQLISGLPPLVREGDRYRAPVTLRNTTQRTMRIAVGARVANAALAGQWVEIPAGEAREIAWDVVAPDLPADRLGDVIEWEITAAENGVAGDATASEAPAQDRIRISQRLLPSVPVTVQQASLRQLDGAFRLPVAMPADALPGRGGLKISLQPKLADGMPAVRDWFERYPFTCLEQRVSKAVGLRDLALWQQLVEQLPLYLDSDGLAGYFPAGEGSAPHGSDSLSAYLLAATHEARQLGLKMTLPDEIRTRIENGLIAFVEGRVRRDFWAPQRDLEVRKLAALEALSRYGKVQPGMLASITLAPQQWPTSAVIDWFSLLQRTLAVPQREARMREAEQILRARLDVQGTRLGFSTEAADNWWWLMVNGDVNAARLILAVLELPQWQEDAPRLLTGLLGRQQRGAWKTTTANLWGGLAVDRFSMRFEREAASGTTRAQLENAGVTRNFEWGRTARAPSSGGLDTRSGARPEAASAITPGAMAAAVPGGVAQTGGRATDQVASSALTALLPWPPAADTLVVTHAGAGRPWVTVQSFAAVPLKAPYATGLRITRTVTPIEQAVPGRWSRGDIMRVKLDVDAQAEASWVVLSDPVPAGATILGGGLGRDSEIATQGERDRGAAWLAFAERHQDAYRAYYAFVPKGRFATEYTVRLNAAGSFALPPTRAEVMYAPEIFGEAPNPRLTVEAR